MSDCVTLWTAAVFKVDSQQGPVVERMELYLVLGCCLDGSGVGRMDACVSVAEPLLCSPESAMTLLIG